MQILSIGVGIPSFKLTNEQILFDLEKYNQDIPQKVVNKYQREVAYLLQKAGSKTRYIRDKNKQETAISLVKSAMLDALRNVNMAKSDIDLLIFCGVGRGFLEPANAYFYANALGMNCRCFDISDACMSWVRALEIAYLFLKSGSSKNIMIINAEFTAYEYGYPDLLKIETLKQIRYTFPTYTIGEAATATIISRSQHEWSFYYESVPQLSKLCAIPLKGYEDFCEKDQGNNFHGAYRFVAYGSGLFETAVKHLVNIVQQKVININEPDIWFPHAASSNVCLEAGKILCIDPQKLYVKTFIEYGNLISASIPVAINIAFRENKLKRGDKVILCPASAGMAFAVVQFSF